MQRGPERGLSDAGPDHPIRQAILSHLDAHPGASLQALCRALDTNRGTTTHHLRILQSAGVVDRIHIGRQTRFFRDAQEQQEAWCVLLRGRARDVAAAVAAMPGVIQKGLVAHLEASRSTVRKHLDALAAQGLVRQAADGRARQYFPTPKLKAFLEQIHHDRKGGRP